MARRVQSINSLLSKLPSEDDDNYTIALKNIVLENDFFNRVSDLETYLNSPSSQYGFAAFYSLLIICRELNYYSKYNSYVDKYGERFNTYKLYQVVLSTFYRNKGILGEKDKFRYAIRFAEAACEALPTNLAVKHHYAAMVVTQTSQLV